MAEQPDAIFIATGSSPIVPPIPGIERTETILDVDNDRVEVGENVVVCGGGLSGCECALELAYRREKCHDCGYDSRSSICKRCITGSVHDASMHYLEKWRETGRR